ncbi:MAG: hypothetical protein U5L09_09165 [Bacteroidales bacterium]|nr:hypothetical protein [Bacteroidales bacterium]
MITYGTALAVVEPHLEKCQCRWILAFLSELAQWLAHHFFLQSSWLLDHIGYQHIAMDNTLTFPGRGHVIIWPSCSGLKQFYQIIFPFPPLPRTMET